MSLLHGEAKTLKARAIPQEICKQYNYKVGSDASGANCQIATYYDKDKQPTAQKIRYKDKTFKFIGAPKESLMFGQQLFGSGGKKLTITEGELDALSVATAFEGKYPVVSIANGIQSAKKEVAKHLEWISSFEEIYIWFDNDEHGLRGLEEVINILPLGKVKIIKHPNHKDANDVLLHEGKSGIVKTFYGAEMYKPEGILLPSELLVEALKPTEYGRPWMFEKMTDITYGRRLGEVVALGAGVSVGKTDTVMQSVAFDLKQGYKVGTFMLEQQPRETLLRIAGKLDGQHYHLPDNNTDPKQLEASILGMTNLYIYDNFGSIDWETISSKIKFMKHNYGVEMFYIDNLTALNAHAQDERRNLDGLMADIAALAKELDIWVLVVSHLNPPKTGASHEAGGVVEQGQLTGSRAIMRWSSFIFGVERNTIHEDPVERQKGLIRCIKDRFSGKATGKTIGFVYDIDTGIQLESEAIEQLDMFEGEDDDY